jgi:hypothetical protein
MSEWLPIATALLDERLKILRRGKRVTCGHWAAKRGSSPAQWVSWDGGFPVKEPPTHWQPMPEPPDD